MGSVREGFEPTVPLSGVRHFSPRVRRRIVYPICIPEAVLGTFEQRWDAPDGFWIRLQIGCLPG